MKLTIRPLTPELSPALDDLFCEFDAEHVAHWLCLHLRARRIQDCCSTRTASADHALRSEGDRAMTFGWPAAMIQAVLPAAQASRLAPLTLSR